MVTVTTRPGEIFIHSSGNVAHLVWNHLSPIKPLILNTSHCCANSYPPLTRVLFSPVLTFLFYVPAIPFSHLPFHPRVAHQTSLAWVCADRKPTDRLPGHSEKSWASFTRPLEETVSQQIHSGGCATQSAPLTEQGSNKGGFACIMLSLIDQQK